MGKVADTGREAGGTLDIGSWSRPACVGLRVRPACVGSRVRLTCLASLPETTAPLSSGARTSGTVRL